MGKRKPDNPSRVVSQGDKPASPIGPPDPPPARHGPDHPLRTLYGLAHLRVALSLSDSATLDQVCNDAVNEILRLREQARPARWANRD